MMSTETAAPRPRSAARIVKNPALLKPPPHLLDYEATCAQFHWDDAASLLDGLPGGPA
jgi:hypothetical protein